MWYIPQGYIRGTPITNAEEQLTTVHTRLTPACPPSRTINVSSNYNDYSTKRTIQQIHKVLNIAAAAHRFDWRWCVLPTCSRVVAGCRVCTGAAVPWSTDGIWKGTSLAGTCPVTPADGLSAAARFRDNPWAITARGEDRPDEWYRRRGCLNTPSVRSPCRRTSSEGQPCSKVNVRNQRLK